MFYNQYCDILNNYNPDWYVYNKNDRDKQSNLKKEWDEKNGAQRSMNIN